MADNNEEAKAETVPEDQAAGLTSAPENGELNPDQSFAYWLVMLPFLAIAGVCIYNFYQSPGNTSQLLNALGAVVVGVFAASFVNALTGDKSNAEGEKPNQDATTGSST